MRTLLSLLAAVVVLSGRPAASGPEQTGSASELRLEATIPVAGGAAVVVRVIDGNDRQIDNSEPGRPDRQQIIKGVVDKPLAGQMLRLDVISVATR